jgi:hypothetical protein
MLADFTINIHEARKPLAVRVKVHDNVAALRMASKKYAIAWDDKDADFSDTCGICHCFHMQGDPVVALVRLAPPHIGAGVVAHEMAHAAVHLWEVQHKWETKHRITNGKDEWFCMVLGELVRQMTIQLIERKIY